METEIILIDDFYVESGVSHGAACAHIIKNVYSNARIQKINLHFHGGKASIVELLKALEYCLIKKVKMIHLSLGTINYYDFLKLKLPIYRLTEQGCIIVTAFHNANIITWPAMFSRVFGVIQDRYSLLRNEQYCFLEDVTEKKDIIVSHYSDRMLKRNFGEMSIRWSNSFAAPVITAVLYQYIIKHTNCNYYDALEYLKKNAVGNINYPDSIQRYPLLDGESVIPNMAILENGLWCKELIQLFRNEGYGVEILENNKTVYVPIQFYLPKGRINKKFIKGMECIYKADIFIYILDDEFFDIYYEIFDIVIKRKKNIFAVLYNDGTEKQYDDIVKMYQAIKAYFK